MFGSIVSVVVDRPLGSYHPKHPDMIYPVNYGYVPGIMAPDGAEQDAYSLGVDVPIDTFTGKVIAIVRRSDDVEDKWVVAPEGLSIEKEDIERTIEFQERFFRSELIVLGEENR